MKCYKKFYLKNSDPDYAVLSILKTSFEQIKFEWLWHRVGKWKGFSFLKRFLV